MPEKIRISPLSLDRKDVALRSSCARSKSARADIDRAKSLKAAASAAAAQWRSTLIVRKIEIRSRGYRSREIPEGARLRGRCAVALYTHRARNP